MTREEERAIRLLTTTRAQPSTDYQMAEVYTMAIKAIKALSVLDEIKAEIEKYIDKEKLQFGGQFDSGLNLALKIIDKYKKESEVEK